MSSSAPHSAEEFLRGLKGQRVLVTAGAAGIGFAIADTLSHLGARVVVCDIAQDALEAAGRKLKLEDAVKADVSSEADVDRLFEKVKASLGGLDALVNNAGIAGPTGGVEEIDPAEWRRCLDVGLTGQFLCARRAVPLLKAAGGVRSFPCRRPPAGTAMRSAPPIRRRSSASSASPGASRRSLARMPSASTRSCPASSRAAHRKRHRGARQTGRRQP